MEAVARACWDRRVPWHTKAVALLVLIVSPLDLVPDVIPVVGYVVDLLLGPLGVLLVRRMIAPEVLAEHRVQPGTRLSRASDRALGGWSVAGLVAIVAAGFLIARI